MPVTFKNKKNPSQTGPESEGQPKEKVAVITGVKGGVVAAVSHAMRKGTKIKVKGKEKPPSRPPQEPSSHARKEVDPRFDGLVRSCSECGAVLPSFLAFSKTCVADDCNGEIVVSKERKPKDKNVV